MEIWKRQSDETDAAFTAFKTYLELDGRNIEKLSKKLGKASSQLYRWSKQYNWTERAAAWDNAVLEDVRQDIRRSLSREMKRQWSEAIELQRLSFAALKAKDMSKASFKSLNEIYHMARQAQTEIIEKLKIDGQDEAIRIEIVDGASDESGDKSVLS